MKIGILTLPLHTNYGGILQAWALQTVLERMGHEVVVFQKEGKTELPRFWKRYLVYAKRLVKKILINPDVVVYREKVILREGPIMLHKIKEFRRNFIHEESIGHLSDISCANFDAFVVGSDQVWRKRYFANMWNGHITDAFLGFCPDFKGIKISYAASFGTDQWELTDEETEECRRLAATFNSISVRESSGIHLCRRYLGMEAIQVLDPTLLLSLDDYQMLISKTKTDSEPFLFSYILDSTPEKCGLVNRIARERRLQIKSIGIQVDLSKNLEERIYPSPSEWLSCFNDASFIVTDSFHACVFSVIFHKPFVVVANNTRGNSRIESLLNQLGISGNLMAEPSDYNPNCDYDIPPVAYDKLETLQQKSKKFLATNLSRKP